MNSIKGIILIMIMFSAFSCNEPKDYQNPFEQKQEYANNEIVDKEKKITQLENELNNLQNVYSDTKLISDDLSAKKDSLESILMYLNIKLKEIDNYDTEINTKNKQLIDLERDKKANQNELEFIKEKIYIANQRIKVYEDELEIYNNQKEKLWSSGAKPADIEETDNMINDIEKMINYQKNNVKELTDKTERLNANINDISKSGKSYSTDIQDNYAAKEVLVNFIEKEKAAVTEQIDLIDNKLNPYFKKEYKIDEKITSVDNKIENIEQQQNELEELKKQIQKKYEFNKHNEVEKSKKSITGVIIVIVLGLLMILIFFYYTGKNKTKRK